MFDNLFNLFKGYTISTKDGSNHYHLITIEPNHKIKLNVACAALDPNPASVSPIKTQIVDNSSGEIYFEESWRGYNTVNNTGEGFTFETEIANFGGSNKVMKIQILNNTNGTPEIDCQYEKWSL